MGRNYPCKIVITGRAATNEFILFKLHPGSSKELTY
jgi:hypothetical protein